MENKKSNSMTFAKKCMLDALILLAKEKELYSISISELCIKAGVSRMSFYRNYTSINDIIDTHLNDLYSQYIEYEKIRTDVKATTDRISHVEVYFDFLYLHHDFIDMLIKYGIDTVFLVKQTEYMIEKYENQSDILYMTSLAGAIYNLYRLWSSSGYTIEKKKIIDSLVSVYSQKN